MPLVTQSMSLVKAIRARAKSGSVVRGISTAYAYVHSMERVLYDDGIHRISKLLGGPTEHQWRKFLKDAKRQLTFCVEDMAPIPGSVRTKAALDKATPNGACGVFDHITTTTKQDRDRDILETRGAEVDPNGPLLLQHLPFELVGKVIGTIKHTKSSLIERSAIVDNAAGNDAMLLVDFGAFRISHGFLPKEWEPLDLEDPRSGFRIHKFEIMERSLVSIPSNTDAVILAWSRASQKMKTPFVKAWAQASFRQRPSQGVGLDLPGKTIEVDESYLDLDAAGGEKHEGDGEEECHCGGQCPRCAAAAKASESEAPACPECGGQMMCPDCGFGMPVEEESPEEDADEPREEDGKSDPIRWNKSLGSEFDITVEQMKPANLFYSLIGKFLGCEMKNVYHMRRQISSYRLGSMLSALDETMGGFKVLDQRNVTSDGSEGPLEFRKIQLNSKESREFLIDGAVFLQGPDGKSRYVFVREPFYAGLIVNCYAVRGTEEELVRAYENATDLMKTKYNFLKGEAFSLSGEFLERSGQKFEDVFLEAKNADSLRRVMKIYNDKQGDAASRGMILMGPPGTGKTLSGRVMKDNVNATFVWISARDFHYAGGMGGFMEAFDIARECSPCVLFFEDVDNWMDSRTVDLIKTEMDGISKDKGILTVLTTNYPERLPAALIDRPGRFHDVLSFDLPSKGVRQQMLERWLPGMGAEAVESIADRTAGLSGAHMYELCSFSKSIMEEESIEAAAAAEKALAKVHEQRELISSHQLSGSRYKMTSRMRQQPILTKHFFAPSRNAAWVKQVTVGFKAGRVLSAKNQGLIEDAKGDADDIAGMNELPRSARALAKECSGKLGKVLTALARPDDPAGEEKTPGTSLSAIDQLCLELLKTNNVAAVDLAISRLTKLRDGVRRGMDAEQERCLIDDLNKLLV